MKPRQFLFAILVCVVSVDSTARAQNSSVYVGVEPEALGCEIAQTIRRDLQQRGRTMRAQENLLQERLRALAVSSAAFNRVYYPWYFLAVMRDADLFQHFALIDLSSQQAMPRENFYGAYILAAEVEGTRRRNLGAAPELLGARDNLRIDREAVLGRIRQYLPEVANFRIPLEIDVAYTEADRAGLVARGLPDYHGTTSVFLPPINPGAIAPLLQVIGKATTLATPLFLWLLDQPRNSLSPAQLFQAATSIYGDPWTALGVIAWMAMLDTFPEYRRDVAVLASRMRPIVFEGRDQAGVAYHFWGYLVRAILGGSVDQLRWNLLSWGYEGLVQGDREDRAADRSGLLTGEVVRRALANSRRCPEQLRAIRDERVVAPSVQGR